MLMISVLSVCCCALLNFESFIHGHFLFLFCFFSFFHLSGFIYVPVGFFVVVVVVVLFVCLVLFRVFEIEKRSTSFDLTNQNGGLPTSLMVKAPPNHNSLCSK